MKVEVTGSDIGNGLPSNAHGCAVFLALKRHIRDDVYFGTGRAFVDFPHKEGGHTTIILPTEAVEFIQRFDNWESVGPFTFDLPIPPWALRDHPVGGPGALVELLRATAIEDQPDSEPEPEPEPEPTPASEPEPEPVKELVPA